jgi:hypothetical protein
MYYAPNCTECGGIPVLHLVRMQAVSRRENNATIVENKHVLTRYRLKENEQLDLEPFDLLAAYCSVCGLMIQIEDQAVTVTEKIIAKSA